MGDRILSVNGCKSTSFVPLFQQPLHELLGPEVKNACVKVEFDITDSVVPTSGEFTVKLMKNDYRNLGITITGKFKRMGILVVLKLTNIDVYNLYSRIKSAQLLM